MFHLIEFKKTHNKNKILLLLECSQPGNIALIVNMNTVNLK